MDIFQFDPAVFLGFILTFIRTSLVLFLLPFFGGNSIPNTAKAALCLVITLTFFPHFGFTGENFPAHPLLMILMVLSEVILGIAMGLLVKFQFAAIQTGGQIIGFLMGFSMVNTVDPLTGTSEGAVAHFLYMVTLLTFLSLNGHLHLLAAFGESFKMIPPGGLVITPPLVEQVLAFSGTMFLLAVKIAAPIMGAILLVDVALALIGRAAPQMHIMLIGFPVKITVGFFFLGLIFQLASTYIDHFIGGMDRMYLQLFQAMT